MEKTNAYVSSSCPHTMTKQAKQSEDIASRAATETQFLFLIYAQIGGPAAGKVESKLEGGIFHYENPASIAGVGSGYYYWMKVMGGRESAEGRGAEERRADGAIDKYIQKLPPNLPPPTL